MSTYSIPNQPGVRVGVIGTSNTHAFPIVGLLNGWAEGIPIPDRAPDGTPMPDMHLWARSLLELEACGVFREGFHGARVTKLWSEDVRVGRQVASAGAVEELVGTPTDTMHDVDIVMILTEDPRTHEELGLASIDRRLPTFIDKPMATSAEEAKRLFERADSAGVPLWSGSSIRFTEAVSGICTQLTKEGMQAHSVYVQCPLEVRLYGIHGFEVVGSILGFDGIASVVGSHLNGRQLIQLLYNDGRSAVVDMLTGLARSVFTIVAYTASRQHVATYSSDGRSLVVMLRSLFSFFAGGPEPYPRDETLAGLVLVDAAQNAISSGRAVAL